jgi:hypothetical protein
VFQNKIQDEYLAENIIDKGSYATVIEVRSIFSNVKYAAKCID